MASTSITAVGGVVTVTQVIPQDSSPKRATPTFPASKMDDMTAAFLRGEPRGLGMVQVSVGLLCVLFSLTSLFSPTLVPHAPLSLAVILVVSGSIAVATAKQPSVGWGPGSGGTLCSHSITAATGQNGRSVENYSSQPASPLTSCRCLGHLIEAGLESLRGDRGQSTRREGAGQARRRRASRTNPSPREQPRGGLC
ncbi:uncharacterized protein si:dkey-7j14.6 isoform X2 [Pseudoliparis swirei]|uniref:uncharacterized protein si:dkey-7j14.6 isoform X2 n=1 Tax=Pseudoliparis swirei TaxID=2059687 RepID=UPI0024BEAB46|nr:uncharacterized protein si:dkey-7j14.6 isoform X2 [Pseudoliparis swirei]